MKFVIVLFLCFSVVSCAARPKSEMILSADYGPYPDNYEQIIKDHYSTKLFDPYSAVYTFNAKPRRDYDRVSSGVQFGWVVCGTINGKNRFGGYVGVQPFYTLIKNGRVIVAYEEFMANAACQAIHGPDTLQ